MSHELFYTSAPKGVQPGSRGFCTVAVTSGMPKPLLEKVESLSGYRPLFPPLDAKAALNPVAYGHLRLVVGNKPYSLLSRICAAGLDYSQRTNKFAHHVVLESDELPAGGPAWLLSQAGFMETAWDGEVKTLPAGRKPPRGDAPAAPCRAWQQATGDAGWAGVAAEALAGQSGRTVYLLFEPGMELLPLLAEAVQLLPPEQRWSATFSTYFTGLPQGVTCACRCVPHDSAEAAAGRRLPGSIVIDLCQPQGEATGGDLVDRARSGRAAAVRAAAARPVPAEVRSERPQTRTAPRPEPAATEPVRVVAQETTIEPHAETTAHGPAPKTVSGRRSGGDDEPISPWIAGGVGAVAGVVLAMGILATGTAFEQWHFSRTKPVIKDDLEVKRTSRVKDLERQIDHLVEGKRQVEQERDELKKKEEQARDALALKEKARAQEEKAKGEAENEAKRLKGVEKARNDADNENKRLKDELAKLQPATKTTAPPPPPKKPEPPTRVPAEVTPSRIIDHYADWSQKDGRQELADLTKDLNFAPLKNYSLRFLEDLNDKKVTANEQEYVIKVENPENCLSVFLVTQDETLELASFKKMDNGTDGKITSEWKPGQYRNHANIVFQRIRDNVLVVEGDGKARNVAMRRPLALEEATLTFVTPKPPPGRAETGPYYAAYVPIWKEKDKPTKKKCYFDFCKIELDKVPHELAQTGKDEDHLGQIVTHLDDKALIRVEWWGRPVPTQAEITVNFLEARTKGSGQTVKVLPIGKVTSLVIYTKVRDLKVDVVRIGKK